MVYVPPCTGCSARARGLFGCLSASQLARLVAVRVPHAYAPGSPAYHEDTPSLAVYCVREGEFKLWRILDNGDQHVVATRTCGDLMGYRAALAGRPYTVTAEPLCRSVACTIPTETFLTLAHENAEFAFGLLQRLAGDSLENEDRLVTRAVYSVRRRTARYLVECLPAGADAAAPPLPLRVPARREEMARLIGTTPETPSRTLHAFAARGILDLQRQEIQVRDLGLLRRIAQ